MSRWLITLAIYKLVNGTAKVGILAFLAATVSVRWSGLDGFEKLCIILAAVAQMQTYIEAQLESIAAKIVAGKPLIGTNGTGQTQFITKDQVQHEDENKTSPPKPIVGGSGTY